MHERGKTVSVLTWDVRKERQMVFVVVRRRLIYLCFWVYVDLKIAVGAAITL